MTTKVPVELSSTPGIVDGSNATAITIDSSANVGIGLTNPTSYYSRDLVVSSSAEQGITIASTNTTNTNYLMFADGTTGNEAYRGYISYSHTLDRLGLATSGTDKMFIDSSGNLLVGMTTASTNNDGVGIRADGLIHGKRANVVATFNRKTSDGTVVQISKDNTEVGIIGAVSGDMFLGTGDANLRFTDAGDGVRPATSAGADLDDHADLGAASARFNNLFLVNNPTVGSDQNLKQDIEDITETEKKVAVKAKALLKKYKYKNSVTDKGNKARIHFGIIAQELQEAFTSEGLDAYDYSMFCSDTWTDEITGEEKTQLGIRYTELLAFIIAAI